MTVLSLPVYEVKRGKGTPILSNLLVYGVIFTTVLI